MAPPSAAPTLDSIETELAVIWPGWYLRGPMGREEPAGAEIAPEQRPHFEPVNLRLRVRTLPEPWLRRIKWLLKWHSVIRQGLDLPGDGGVTGCGVQLIKGSTPGLWYAHPVPNRGYQAQDEPAKVSSAPPATGAAMPTQQRSMSPAAIAIQLARPLPAVRAALADLPPGADALAHVLAKLEGGSNATA